MRIFGFITGMGDTPATSKPLSAYSEEVYKDKALILKYLLEAPDIIYYTGIEKDLRTKRIIPSELSSSIKSDGVWAWPNYLSYYLNEYNLKLDIDFLDEIRNNGYTIPNSLDIKKMNSDFLASLNL